VLPGSETFFLYDLSACAFQCLSDADRQILCLSFASRGN
jgi:hypothetical protein